MSLTGPTWLAVFATPSNILEEYQLNWREWARAPIKLPVAWGDFYVPAPSVPSAAGRQ